MDTHQVSNKTKLKDRTLWFDGDSSYPAKTVHTSFVGDQHKIFVDEITKDIEQYNKIVSADKRITVKKSVRPLTFDWIIPEAYKKLELTKYLIERLDKQNVRDEKELEKRAIRVAKELKLYKQHKLLDVLRVLIYVINTLNSNSVVWGVGRGSSVSSYVLYLIGVHDVDSVKYELNIEDFLH